MKQALILGGTRFIGRRLVEILMLDGEWELSLFHRGKTNPDIFPGFRHLHGDRSSAALSQITDRHWDVVGPNDVSDRGIESFPTGARQIHFSPGVGRPEIR